MNITADTNILIRATTGDHFRQSPAAKAELERAPMPAVSLQSLCEVVWVLSRGFKVSAPPIAELIRALASAANIVVDHPAVEAGLSMLDSGGDFAVGVIAHEGRALGGEEFVSFDRNAVTLLQAHGKRARLLEA